MRSELKRRKIFLWLHNQEASICLLQETHSTQEDENRWKSEWGASVYFAHGSRNSKGVCILIKNNVDFVVHAYQGDSNGRFLILDVTVNSKRISLINVYGPNKDNPEFFQDLFQNLELYDNEEIIMGGDFNCILDSELDRRGENDQSNTESRKVLATWMDEMDVIDIWRLHHPLERKFTWLRYKPKLVMRRLDFFLVSYSLIELIDKSEIRPDFLLDHSNITINFNSNFYLRGPSYWKLNCSLLNDLDYTQLVKHTIFSTVEINSGTEPVLLWETIKNQIRGTTIQYSSEKSKTYLNKIKTLQNNLYDLESKFQENPSEVLHNNILEVKTELEQELEKKTKGAMVRSRARWYEEGERSSKYFLRMEKRNYSNKCINRIKLDDESITAD